MALQPHIQTSSTRHTVPSASSWSWLCAAFVGAALFIAPLAAPRALAELTVQIGAFVDQPQSSFAARAREFGEVLELRGDDGVTRVSVGRFDRRQDAAAALAQLQIAGFSDAYITNVRGTNMSRAANTATTNSVTVNSEPASSASTPGTPRTITNSTSSSASASRQRLPSGNQIVVPKQAVTETVDESDAQAGRFRLRTHDTTSGQTRDFAVGGTPASAPIPPGVVVAGAGANEIPQHLRDKLVYLDGVPHIKEGERFIPLTDAVDGKP